jgi:hypothetical protein
VLERTWFYLDAHCGQFLIKLYLSRALSLPLSVATGSKFLNLPMLEQDVSPDKGCIVYGNVGTDVHGQPLS